MLSSIQSNRQGLGKSPQGESNPDLVESYLENPDMVSKVARNEH